MKTLHESGVVAVAALLLAVPSVCLAQAKVAVVQMDKVMKAAPEAQRAMETLNTVREEYEKEQEKMETRLKELRQGAETSYSEANDKTVSDAERQKREEKAKQSFSSFREYEQKVMKTRRDNQRDLADQEMRQFKRIMAKLREIIAEYAAEQKIDVVLDATGVGVHGGPLVLYSADKLDITDAIVKKIESSAKKSDLPDKKTESK